MNRKIVLDESSFIELSKHIVDQSRYLVEQTKTYADQSERLISIGEQNKMICAELKDLKNILRGNGHKGLCETVAVHETCYAKMNDGDNNKIDKIDRHDSYFKMITFLLGISLTVLGGLIVKIFF